VLYGLIVNGENENVVPSVLNRMFGTLGFHFRRVYNVHGRTGTLLHSFTSHCIFKGLSSSYFYFFHMENGFGGPFLQCSISIVFLLLLSSVLGLAA